MDPQALAQPFLSRARAAIKEAEQDKRRRRQRRQLEAAVAPLREAYAFLLEYRQELRDVVMDIEDAVPGGASPHWFALRAWLGLDTEYLP